MNFFNFLFGRWKTKDRKSQRDFADNVVRTNLLTDDEALQRNSQTGSKWIIDIDADMSSDDKMLLFRNLIRLTCRYKVKESDIEIKIRGSAQSAEIMRSNLSSRGFKRIRIQTAETVNNKRGEDEECVISEFYIAGLQYHVSEDSALWQTLSRGDAVNLNPEQDNRYDRNAVAVHCMNEENSRLGYIPRTENAIIAKLLKSGHEKIIRAEIKAIEDQVPQQKRIQIRVILLPVRKD